MPRTRARALVAVTLLGVMATASPMVATAAVDPPVTVSPPSPFARGCALPARFDVAYGNAEAEPHLAVDPTDPGTLVAAWQQDRRPDGGARGILTATSRDGGNTWLHPPAPAFTRCTGATATAFGSAFPTVSDPWLSIGPDGRVYLTALAVGATDRPRSAILAATSADHGLTWSAPVSLIADPGGSAFNDKNSVTADPTRPGVAYTTWTRVAPSGAATFLSRTADGGATWDRPRAILFPTVGGLDQGHQIVVLPDGTLVDVFVRRGFPSDQQMAIRSTDGGETWAAPIPIATLPRPRGVVDPFDGRAVRTGGGLPDVAVAGTGALYVTWEQQQSRLPARVMLAASSSGGLTWSTPRRVNANRRVHAFTPSVAVAADGTVGVAYFDFTSDRPGRRPLLTDVWFTRSTNGGASFTRRERLRQASFDLRNAPRTERGFFLGDYHGLVATGSAFHALFTVAPGRRGDRTRIVATTVR